MSILSNEEVLFIKNKINNQKGQNYPCSNQSVICGFFGKQTDFEKFKESYNKDIIRGRKEFFWTEKECWYYFSDTKEYSPRGYRFYKLKVPRNIDKDLFDNIYTYCGFYCCNIDFY